MISCCCTAPWCHVGTHEAHRSRVPVAYGDRVRTRVLIRYAVPLAALLLALGRVDPATADGDVDVFVGTGGRPPWFSGNTTPAAARPFGMVQLGPDTTDDAETGSPSQTASGYAISDPLLRGFSPTHLSGAGCPVLGDVPVLPVVGRLPTRPGEATVPLDHTSETAGPGWYRTRLGNGIGVALAAADRAGLARYTFPTGRRGTLLVKASGSLAGVHTASVRFPGPREVAVSATGRGFCGSPGRYRVHVLLRFDRPVGSRGTWGATPGPHGSVRGPGVGGWVRFDTRERRAVRVQVGVSFVDASGARGNLDASRPGWSVPDLITRAGTRWARELGRLAVSGGTEEERRRLGTALYHVLLHPTTDSDADGRYPGFDGRPHTVPSGHRHYTALAGWDAYRTHLPLIAWLRPDVASDAVRSLHAAAREGGWLPRWPLLGSYTGVMNGDSAAPMVAAAHAFGARDFPLGPVVTRLTRQAEAVDGQPGQGWFQPRPGLADYRDLGYVPNTTPERGWSQPHGASTTLEYAVDDFALSRLALAAGRPEVAARMRLRSGSWRGLLDIDRRLLLPRDASGDLPGPAYDPASCCHGFQEGNALQYAWSVPQDMAGLLAEVGPPEQAVARLTDLHTALNAGAGQPFAWMGNQPSFATPWAYLWLGRPDLTTDVVARARATLWDSTPGGVPGNEDLGGLSAWYVWASLGLYPVTPGTAVLGVSTPAFPRVVVRPSVGRTTRIERVGTGSRVGELVVDGVTTTSSWLDAGPASRPATIVVRTTDAALPAWGTAEQDRPPSYPAG